MGIFANNMPVKKIGMFGGTFNPVHYGHLRVALECKQALQLDEMRLMICSQPPHRELPDVTDTQRKAMLELAIDGSPEFIIDSRELDRQGPSYSVDTLQSLRAEYPEAALFMVIGSDSFQSLNTWHRWQEILELANIVIAKRPDNIQDENSPMGIRLKQHFLHVSKIDEFPLAGAIISVPVTQLEISATQIRQLIMKGYSCQYLLPDKVINYIKSNSLYLNR